MLLFKYNLKIPAKCLQRTRSTRLMTLVLRQKNKESRSYLKFAINLGANKWPALRPARRNN